MPGEDGYSFLRRVRALPGTEGGRTPAAALTAYARPADRERAIKAGFHAHLSKPVLPAELAIVVSQLARMAEMGLDPLPAFTPPYEYPEAVPALAERYPLTLISSPAHHFLNSTFVNVESLRRAAREPECLLHPADAERRGIAVGARVVVHNDRGAFTAVARVEDSIRPGVVWAPSIWWGKFAADGANANQTTSQRETDMGHGPVFYDNLVEVGLAD
jgi:anaerobic selenocysteine-containing dehydrogenase